MPARKRKASESTGKHLTPGTGSGADRANSSGRSKSTTATLSSCSASNALSRLATRLDVEQDDELVLVVGPELREEATRAAAELFEALSSAEPVRRVCPLSTLVRF